MFSFSLFFSMLTLFLGKMLRSESGQHNCIGFCMKLNCGSFKIYCNDIYREKKTAHSE